MAVSPSGPSFILFSLFPVYHNGNSPALPHLPLDRAQTPPPRIHEQNTSHSTLNFYLGTLLTAIYKKLTYQVSFNLLSQSMTSTSD